jgi:HlyD family secretion protein
MKRILPIALLVIAVAALSAFAVWRLNRPEPEAQELTLFGNIDLRQVDLPFNNSERIAAVLVQEGDRVHRGQVLARLDLSRLNPQLAQTEAQAEAQKAVVERFHNGSRPEEIAQARSNVDAAAADAQNARVRYDRVKTLMSDSKGSAVSQEDLDAAKATLDVAEAKLMVSRKALDLSVAGPRKEDVAQAEAMLRYNEAALAFARQQVADAQLIAPIDAVVRSRLMEPGEMASPQKPVFTLAITDPKWVRAYVSETDLGKVHMGLAATATFDSFPGRRFNGWVGFISPIAEFTPKAVQTEELRTKLVYEVRVFVNDPSDELRLGMPATVHLPLNAAPSTAPR